MYKTWTGRIMLFGATILFVLIIAGCGGGGGGGGVDEDTPQDQWGSPGTGENGIPIFWTRLGGNAYSGASSILETSDHGFIAAKPRQRLYLQALISTLARVSELNKLKWEDVHDGYLILKTRKAKNSNLTERAIPINQTLSAVLQAMPKIGEYVFCYLVDGTPYQYRSKLLKVACKKAGVKEFGYHALRHYGASKLADSGIPITVIQTILGHTTTTTTDIYLQSIKQSVKDAVKKLESPI
jgi:integrase